MILRKKDLEEQKLLKKLLNMILYGEKGKKVLNFLRSEKNRLSKSFKKAKEEGNLEEVIAQSKEVANEIKELGPKN